MAIIEKTVYVCPVCKETFDDESEAQDHLSDHEVEEEYIYECEACGDTFDTLGEAKNHEAVCSYISNSCKNCHNFEYGKSNAPCPRVIFDEDMSPCDEYQRMKVAL